jgi:hypothetical protein
MWARQATPIAPACKAACPLATRRLFRHFGCAMGFPNSLAVLPFLGILVGAVFCNRVTPLVFGMPLLLAWLVLWILLTSAIMAVIYWCDPANRTSADTAEPEA